ncbi:sigma-70 family RNA polymerase sigma factor [Limnochorda pilosa]|uniref:RNA polymerase sigma 70 n=1 Tax=Limnochorda pilosa TaxID=1555112 RepID=A0A0K2SI80_LIMPI|nr:sigma-70 family RNA polymerase sigma factor [Limnochorda pilosa]BAS26836.1 RNA polymerase sigma 70 [Limnochorda pilosa]
MDDKWLAERFEADRPRLQAVACRLLGSANEADDAVQEAWLRLSRSDTRDVKNLSGWLTTVVARVCLDMLRSRRSRREVPLSPDDESIPDAADPEREAMLAESVGQAMLEVLQRLAPAERVAFVLHDVFGVSFEEIAGIVGRSPVAARQLASRGRRRVKAASEDRRAPDVARHREIVEAFFQASRAGDFQALLAVLDPDVALRADEAALRMGVRTGWLTSELRGATAVARHFAGRAEAAQLALVDGVPGVVWAPGGTPRVVFGFTIRNGRVVEIELAADTERLNRLKIEILP